MTGTVSRRIGSGYSRITLVGLTRRADLVLPSDEPVGTLLAEMIGVLGEPYSGGRLVLMTATGALVPSAATLADAGVTDGDVLRLVAEQSAPPPPVVNDVTEETAVDLGTRGGRWSTRTSQVFASCGAGLAAAVLAAQVYLTAGTHDQTSAVALCIAGGLVWVVALGLGWTRQVAAVVSAAVVGAVLAAGGLELLAHAHHWVGRDRVAAALAVGWVALAVATAGRRRPGELTGAALGAVLTGTWVWLGHLVDMRSEADAVVVLAAALASGVLPRWALATSGLATLDDRRLIGAPVRRERLRRSLRDAHIALIAATAAVSVSVAVCGAYLALTGTSWPVAVAAAGAVVLLLRSRSLPLAAEGALMLASAAVVATALALTWVTRASSHVWPLTATVVVLLAVYACGCSRPAAHIAARLRAVGDRVEAVAVIALIPLVVGTFGVFGDLLHTFHK